MISRAFGVLAVVAVMSGCVLTGPTFRWKSFKPTGEVYEYEGKRYDVYAGTATAVRNDEEFVRDGRVLFPEGTGPASLRAQNIAAVCWDGDDDPCEISFGKQLRKANAPVRDEGGMGY